MKKRFVIIVCALFCLLYASRAQSKIGEASWQVSFPQGEFKDFVGNPGWLGFTVQGRRYMKDDRLSIGGSLNWFYFSDKQGYQTVELKDGGTYSGHVTDFTNIYGLLFVAQYDLKPKLEKTVPFVRAGVGGAYQNQARDIGLYEIKNNGIQFMMNAEAGVRIGDKEKGMILAATWHYLPSAGDILASSFFGIKLGFSHFK